MKLLTSTKAYAHFAAIAVAVALAAGCAQTDNSNPTAPSSFAGTLGSAGSASLSAKPVPSSDSTAVTFSNFDVTTLTVTMKTTTTSTVGQPYISEGKIQLQILVDATGKAVPCGTPGATYVRFDTYGNGGAAPDASGVVSTVVDLDNLYVTTGGAVQNVACGDKICIKAHYITGGGPTKVGTHFAVEKPYEVVCTSVCGQLGQGYWKNHYPTSWPASVASGGMTLGTVSYSAAQLESVFLTPVAGNGLISLAHQLIAAKLNVANGSDATTIASTIASADSLIGGLSVPPVGGGYLAPASTGALISALDAYNSACGSE